MLQSYSIAGPLERALRVRCSVSDTRTLALGEADQFFDSLIGLEEVTSVSLPFAEDQIGYIAASVHAVLRMLDALKLKPGDVLCDVGSGLGRIPILAHLLTDLPTLGVELDKTLHEQAQELIEKNNLRQVKLINQDARFADLSSANVFSFNLPFDGELLQEFLANIRPVNSSKRIRIYPYAWHLVFWEIPWLKPVQIPGTECYYFTNQV